MNIRNQDGLAAAGIQDISREHFGQSGQLPPHKFNDFPRAAVRKIPRSPVSLTGRLASRKGFRPHAFESSLERDALILLDSDPTVDYLLVQPVKIEFRDSLGTLRTYTPDILVAFRPDPLTGKARKPLLIEVKPRASLARKWDQLRPKFKAAIHHASTQRTEKGGEQGWRFMILTEQEIRVPGFLPNLRFLRGVAAKSPDPRWLVTVLDGLRNGKECTIQQLLDRVCPTKEDQASVLPVVWHLIEARKVWTDLQKPLTNESLVRHALAPDPKFLWGTDGPPLRTRLVPLLEPVPTCSAVAQPVISLSKGADVMVEGRPCIILRVLDLQTVLVRDKASGLPEKVRVSVLGPYMQGEPKPRILPDLVSIPEAAWAEAYERAAVIRPLRIGRRTKERIDQAAVMAGVSRPTIYRWLNQFVDAGELTSALLPHKPSGGRGKSRLPEEVEKIIQDTLESHYLRARKPKPSATAEEVFRRCKAAGIKAPHHNTIRKRIEWISAEKKVRRRFGNQMAHHMFDTFRGPFPTASWPLETIQMDHTPVDIILVDERTRNHLGRPWLTLAMDVYSRMVVGYQLSLDPPGALSTGLCLANAILPKEQWLASRNLDIEWPCWGIPGAVHVDNAKEFRGDTLQMGAQEYGFNIEWRVLEKPEYGGHIERMMGTIAGEVRKLRGTTFSSVAARGSYKSTKKACMTLKEFEEWFSIFITENYHNRPHSGLGGETPLERYKKGLLGSKDAPGRGLPDRIGNEAKLRLDFLPHFARTVQRHGIEIDCITYYSPVLQTFRNEMDPDQPKAKRSFTVRRDPRDISVIYLLDPKTGAYLGIPYRDRSHPPVSLWEWKASEKVAKPECTKEENEQRRFKAIESQRAIEDGAFMKTAKARRNSERRRIHQELDLHGHKAKKVAGDPIREVPTTPTGKSKPKQVVPLQSATIQPFDDLE